MRALPTHAAAPARVAVQGVFGPRPAQRRQPPPPRAAPPNANPDAARAAHNAAQAAVFDDAVDAIAEAQPPEVVERLHRIVASVPGLGPHSRVLDVGAGTGCLVPPLRARGVSDVLAVDVAPAMLARLRADHGADAATLGNDAAVRTWLGDVESVPPYQGPVDAIFFNAVFGNVADQASALTAAALLLKPGGHIVVSHPLGRAWHGRLRDADPDTVPHALPDGGGWGTLLVGQPLRLVQLVDEAECYIAVLQVPPALTLADPPLLLNAPVVTGFGRGSRAMGVPTANLDTAVVGAEVATRPRGVYFGFARLLNPPPGSPAADGRPHPAVLNIGARPTFADGDDVSVEVHVMHEFASDFYGARLAVAAGGFIRPEMRFASLRKLVARIRADLAAANVALATGEHDGMRRQVERMK